MIVRSVALPPFAPYFQNVKLCKPPIAVDYSLQYFDKYDVNGMLKVNLGIWRVRCQNWFVVNTAIDREPGVGGVGGAEQILCHSESKGMQHRPKSGGLRRVLKESKGIAM